MIVINPPCAENSKTFRGRFFFWNAQLRNGSIFTFLFIEVFLNRSLSELEKDNNFEPALIEAYRYSPFQKTSFIRNRSFLSFSLVWCSYLLKWEIWSLKNDIINCLGEWEIISLNEERDEDENENDWSTNTSFFI